MPGKENTGNGRKMFRINRIALRTDDVSEFINGEVKIGFEAPLIRECE